MSARAPQEGYRKHRQMQRSVSPCMLLFSLHHISQYISLDLTRRKIAEKSAGGVLTPPHSAVYLVWWCSQHTNEVTLW